jgi:hypothetical protein
MPSPRPANPNPSVVVALIFTDPWAQSEHFRDPRLHGVAIRADFGLFTNQGDVRMDRYGSGGPRQRNRMIDKGRGGGSFPLGIRGRKVLADISRANRPQEGVHERVQTHIRIRMANQLERAGDIDPAEPDAITRSQPVHIISCSADCDHLLMGSGHLEILGESQFDVGRVTVNDLHRHPTGTRKTGLVRIGNSGIGAIKC